MSSDIEASRSVDRSAVVDPVCGMSIDSSGPFVAEHEGRRYHFCSEYCQGAFAAAPDQYTGATGEHARRRAPGLEPVTTAVAQYTCPMHPEIRRAGPGACPICGMALEPVLVSADTGPSHELIDMTRRFWVGLVLAVPVFALEMGGHLFDWVHDLIPVTVAVWVQLVFATPVVLWCGWPFFVRGWASVRSRNLNMFTLIAMGTGVAWVYSVIATVAPGIFPASFRTAEDMSAGEAMTDMTSVGTVDVYFEAAAIITVLVLLGQVLELRAREQTSGAIKALLDLTPKTARRLSADGTEQEIGLQDVQVGDQLRVRPGEKVPVDGVVATGGRRSMRPWSPVSRCRSPRPPVTP